MWFYIFFIQLSIFSTTLYRLHGEESSEWKVDIKKNKDRLKPGEELKVDIFCNYPQKFEPDIFKFLLDQKTIGRLGYFNYLNGKWNIEKKGDMSTLHLQILLKAELGNSLIYTPGTLTFSSESSEYNLLIPAIKVASTPTFVVLEAAHLLPLNPKLAISMNQENYNLSFQNTHEKEKNVSIMQKRSFVWTSIFTFFAGIGVLIGVLALIIEFDLVKKKARPPKRRDLLLEFENIEKSYEINHPSQCWQELGRFIRDLFSLFLNKELCGKTSQELKEIMNENSSIAKGDVNFFSDLFSRLDLIEFSNTKPSEDEWKTTCKTFSHWLETNLASFY